MNVLNPLCNRRVRNETRNRALLFSLSTHRRLRDDTCEILLLIDQVTTIALHHNLFQSMSQLQIMYLNDFKIEKLHQKNCKNFEIYI